MGFYMSPNVRRVGHQKKKGQDQAKFAEAEWRPKCLGEYTLRTLKKKNRRMWTEGDIQREPHIGIKGCTNIHPTWFTIFKITLSRPGMNLKQIVSHTHSTHPTHPTRKSQTLNSTKPLPERKLRKC